MTLQHHKKTEIVTEVTSGYGYDFYFLFRLSAFPTYYYYSKTLDYEQLALRVFREMSKHF